MNKLTLNCDALTVDSFPTTREMDAAAGTIHAQALLEPSRFLCGNTLGTKPTCCPCTPRDGEF